MRILHICQRDDPDTGGSLRVAEALVHEQRKAGLDAWLLFLYGKPSDIFASLAPCAVCLGLDSSKEAIGGIWALQRAIKKIAPDIIHSHDGILWPRITFLFIRTPVVTHTHLPIANTPAFKDAVGAILVRATTKSLIGISLHTIGTWIRNKYPPSRIHYVPNGVDFHRFSILDKTAKKTLRNKLELPTDKCILLWVGRVHREMKGADRVERIAAQLPDNMVLVVVGNGPDFQGMQEHCSGLIAKGRMILAGTQSSTEEYYQTADCFLFTSYHEPFGLVILEAVASGLPIFAFPVTRGGGAVDLLSEFKATVLDDTAPDEQIRQTLSEYKGQIETANRSREKALKVYSWSTVSRQIVDVYKLVLNKTL